MNDVFFDLLYQFLILQIRVVAVLVKIVSHFTHLLAETTGRQKGTSQSCKFLITLLMWTTITHFRVTLSEESVPFGRRLSPFRAKVKPLLSHDKTSISSRNACFGSKNPYLFRKFLTVNILLFILFLRFLGYIYHWTRNFFQWRKHSSRKFTTYPLLSLSPHLPSGTLSGCHCAWS